jgi:hypothetical protein
MALVAGTAPVGAADAPHGMFTPASIQWVFPAGSVIVAPAKANHFALTKQPTILEVAAMGPLALTYVNPADDPSKK